MQNTTCPKTILTALLIGGGFTMDATAVPVGSTFQLSSSAFKNGGDIPAKYTCQGENISPALKWTNLPAKTKSLVLIVDDPDAPDPAAPKMTWIHWVLFDIPPGVTELPEGTGKLAALPKGIREGTNDFKVTAYGGPCPPIGQHRYFFKLFALDNTFGDLKQADSKTLQEAMKGHILAKTELVGLYQKKK